MASSAHPPVAVLSLHPQYAEAILAGEKTVEFRRRAFGRDVERVVIYATAPVQRLVGEFTVDGIDQAAPARLWARYGRHGSIDRASFDRYYEGAEAGAAIRVGSASRFPEPLPLSVLGSIRPPQSFAYVSAESLDRVTASVRAGLFRVTAQVITGLLRRAAGVVPEVAGALVPTRAASVLTSRPFGR